MRRIINKLKFILKGSFPFLFLLFFVSLKVFAQSYKNELNALPLVKDDFVDGSINDWLIHKPTEKAQETQDQVRHDVAAGDENQE